MTQPEEDPLGRFRLDGKVAVVTGASSGIGERIATAFAAVGATVYAVARRADRLQALAERQDGIVPWPADLGNPAVCEQLVEDVAERAGRLDILVNNAGIANIVWAEKETTSDFRRLIDVNLLAPFILSRESGRRMIEQGGGGAIVNIASVTGMVGIGLLPQAGYAATKAGCINLTRELAAQWARHGIRVNAIVPGLIQTEMTGEWMHSEQGQKVLERTTPMRRPGTADEVMYAALFLAADAGSYVTGAVIPVDGGWTAV